ncbi:unnamed protein product [Prorocentrum cordatum]|uniref:Uncharacterized protein n=1 Tax=Prorocentrum cordatum TaxID=2364126 RepID=A0ABN9V3K0_9DINO|nr:unnamed protein product [Polarella glacialis]
MSCFLASLLVLGKHMATEHVLRRRVLGHFRAACRFPPAVAALGAVLGGRHRQLQEADKGALACAAFKVFRAAAPAEVGDGRVFEQSRILFSMLVGHSASGDGEGELWRSVRLPAGGAEAEDEEEEEENAWLDAEERGAAAESGAGCEEVVGSAWLARRAPWLRAAWPNCDEVSLWVGPAGEPAAGAHARSCRYPWTTLRSECGKDDAVPLKLVATLSLMHAAPPCLTRGAGGRVVVFRGMPPCSVGEVLLFDPLTGEERGVDPHKHAQELGRLPGCEDEEDVDARGGLPAKEAVIVCLDTSKSMCQDTGFPEEGDEAAQEDHQGPSVEENGWDETPPEDDSPTALLEALRRLSAHPNLEDFRCALKAETTAGGQETLALVLLQARWRITRGRDQGAPRLGAERHPALLPPPRRLRGCPPWARPRLRPERRPGREWSGGAGPPPLPDHAGRHARSSGGR